MLALDLEQGTAEWFAAKLGTPSASNFDKIVTTKGEPSKQAEKYLWRLAGERVSGTSEETYQNGIMQKAIETEAEAREFYELTQGVTVKKVGIVYPDNGKKYACSPDGLVGNDGGLEIKCPIMSTQVGYLLDGKLPTEYFQQIQGNLFVTGRKWWDFLSYFPGIKPLLIRVEREEEFIAKLKTALDLFCAELQTVVKKIS